IGDDRDRDRGGNDSNLRPRPGHHQIGPGDREGEQGDKGSNAAAGFGHAETDLAEVNDVAVEKNRDPEQIEYRGRVPCGQVLEWEGQGIEEDGRYRNHEEKERQRKREDAKNPWAKMKEDEARPDDNQGAPHQKKLRADVAQDELDDADHEHEETDPAP